MAWRSKGRDKSAESGNYRVIDKGVRFEGMLRHMGLFPHDAQMKGNLLSDPPFDTGRGRRGFEAR